MTINKPFRVTGEEPPRLKYPKEYIFRSIKQV